MSAAEDSLPDLIADRATAALARLVADTDPALAAALGDLARRAVLEAFGCTCPPHATSPARHCPVHGTARPRPDEPVMGSHALSWEDDPYDGYTSLERREGVQENLRTAAEHARAFRSDLAATLRRGQSAQNRIGDSIEHAEFNGGLTTEELDAAQKALTTMHYSLRLLYFASNHVGDPPGSEQYR